MGRKHCCGHHLCRSFQAIVQWEILPCMWVSCPQLTSTSNSTACFLDTKQNPNNQQWKTQQWPQDWKRSVFIPVPKKGNTKECSNYHTIAFISHTCKVMLKILQAKLEQYMNQELSDNQAGFRKGRETRDQISSITGSQKKKRNSRKEIYFCFTNYAKSLTVWITAYCGKFLKRWEYQTT